jgi:serine palmitoyltransferase
LSYYILTLFGWLRDILRATGLEKKKAAKDPNPSNFPPLYSHYENFYKKNMFIRGQDIMNRPISSVPGANIKIAERHTDDYNWSFRLTGRHIDALNLGSYNYLGFAENDGICSQEAIESIHKYGIASCSSRQEFGNLQLQNELENLMRKFLGVEECITFGMGFATNSLNIPALIDKHCLIFSDSLNHTSIVLGCRLSGAKVVPFKHNDCKDLERKIREHIINGKKNSKRLNTDWKKIFIIIEGIYSMEGSIAPLREFIALKKKYKAYLYLDEAHSIGALGPTGRGVVDYWGCDPNDVDILMGTFTKSFGSAGGYIAGSKDLINHVRLNSHAQCYASSMSPPVIQQIISSIRVIMGLDGTNDGRLRIERLRSNGHYFREKLKQMGFIVYGNNDSPIVPLMVFMPAKLV